MGQRSQQDLARQGHGRLLADEKLRPRARTPGRLIACSRTGGRPLKPTNTAGVCHANDRRGSSGPRNWNSGPIPAAPRRGRGPVWRQVPGGAGSLCSSSADTWCPPSRPRGRRARAGRLLAGRQDRTRRDAGGAATSKPHRIPGRPARGRGGGAPAKPVGHRPLPATTGCCRSPRRWPQSQAWGPPKVPPPPSISHQTPPSRVPGGRSCRGPHPL